MIVTRIPRLHQNCNQEFRLAKLLYKLTGIKLDTNITVLNFVSIYQ